MVIIVCGGRNYSDEEFLNSKLSSLHKSAPISLLVQGGANGADFLAKLWALKNNIPTTTVMADWDAHGKAAGPIRNKKMIDDYSPEMVIAFSGGKGTNNMLLQAQQANIITKIYLK